MIHLRAHSAFSFLDGITHPHHLAQAAAESQMPALALSDYKNLSGAIEFYEACHHFGIKPILGLEFPVSLPHDLNNITTIPKGNLVLLATNFQGWQNLCRLCSSPDIQSDLLTFEQMAEYSSGLICLSGGIRGSLDRLITVGQEQTATQYLGSLVDVFSRNVYIELQIHSASEQLTAAKLNALSQSSGVPCVATHNIHYLTQDQSELQRVACAIRLNNPLVNLEAIPQYSQDAPAPPGAFFKSTQEMERTFVEYPKALSATLDIAERCDIQLPLGKPVFPNISLPAGQSTTDLLRSKALVGAQKLYGKLSPNILNRLEHEISVITKLEYASLFLIMEEILAFTRQHNIPTASRGSSSSSLVAHCLGITSPDPLRLNLYFERFLNPARATPPDIDTDLCSRRRDEVIDFVYRKYGKDRVAMVCTINRFRRRSALREVAKAYSLPSQEISKMVDLLPHRWHGPTRRDRQQVHPYTDLMERFSSSIHSLIFKHASELIGLPHHLSIHPGGVVIAPGPITDLAPTQLAAKGIRITQFDLDSIERLGLVKIDLLGIRGLSVLGDVALQLSSRSTYPQAQVISHPKPADGTLSFLDSIPNDDADTRETIRQGHTIGCFQIESPGMRATLREIQAKSIDDLMVALALYRPGPLTGGLKEAFVRRHLGQEPVAHLHPALSDLLADTYGVILYQEQVLRIAHELAGLSLADADLLRRAMSHFDPGKQMQTLKEKFIAGALALNSVAEDVAERIWDLMAAFAGYGFPKAHAASYAVVGWRAAWCKTHHPELFMAAVLANWGGYYSQRVYLSESRRLGLQIKPPHINHAKREFSVSYINEKPVLFMGLDQVRELTRATQARIMRMRPYTSLIDFLARVDPRPIEAENLIRCGALSGFGSIPSQLAQIKSPGWRGGQLSLFTQVESERPEWTLAQQVAAQEEILGTSIAAHPLELVADQISTSGVITTLEASTRVGDRLRVSGMRQHWRRSLTNRGEIMYFMSLEDLDGVIQVVIFADTYRRFRAKLRSPGPYIIEGIIEINKEEGDPWLRAEIIDLLDYSPA